MTTPTDNIAPLIDAALIAVEAFDLAQHGVLAAKSTRLLAAQEAAKAMAAASDAGATQMQIAEGVNKSQPWVSAMIAWHRKPTGYGKPWQNHNSPFAIGSKAARDKRAAKLSVEVQKTDNPPAPTPVKVMDMAEGMRSKPAPNPYSEPVNVTVTKVEPEVPTLVPRAEGDETPPTPSEKAFREFKFACELYIPRMAQAERNAAVALVMTTAKVTMRSGR